MLTLNAGACVRSLTVESTCNNCEVICPTQAIVVGDNPLPLINHAQCVSCGACDAVCPSEALPLDDFKPTDFFFDFIEDKDNLISCKKNVPCIAALNVEHLVSTAVLKKEIVFDMGHCDACVLAYKCEPQIVKIYEEATYILEAMENTATIKLLNIKYVPPKEETKEKSRRDFLSSMDVKGALKVKHSFEKEIQSATDELIEHTLAKTDIALLRRKTIPSKRKLFYTAIKRVEKPSTFHVIDATEISFTSSKLLDEDLCTACQMCYRICPTGALTSDIKNSKIDFDPFICIKCHSCHDVCEPDALTVSPSYNIKEFFEPSVVNLIKFKVKRCNECNVIYSTNDSTSVLCYRCKAEDDEARELHGITERY